VRKILAIGVLACSILLAGCGDDAMTLPIGIKLGSTVADFKKEVIVNGESKFQDTVPATLIEFNSPPKPMDGNSVKYEAQTREGKVIAVMIWLHDSNDERYEKIKSEVSSSFGDSVASEAGVTNKGETNDSVFKCASKMDCSDDKYSVFKSGEASALVSLDGSTISIIYAKNEDMKKAMWQ
jgi:hypothetical protein